MQLALVVRYLPLTNDLTFPCSTPPPKKKRDLPSSNHPAWQPVTVSPSLLQAFAEILSLNQWERFAVLYEDNTALLRLQGVLQMPRFRPEYRMFVRQLPVNEKYRHLLRQLMREKVYRVVLDCDVKTVETVLKQAQQVGMMTAEYSFFITSLVS